MTKALQEIRLNQKNVKWHPTPKDLTCVIVEPRNHPNLRGALYNMANVYANMNVGLTIYHSKNNIGMIKEITNGWTGVELHCLSKDNLTIKQYSELLTSDAFYTPVVSTHLLIFQTDSCIFKTIPRDYFKYDYVGAPWKRRIGNGCGNGGFSLRRRSTMIKVCRENKHPRHPEDVFFANAQGLQLPPKALQSAFSVENIKHSDPVGCHQKMTVELYAKLGPLQLGPF